MELTTLLFELSDNVIENGKENCVRIFFDSWLNQQCYGPYTLSKYQNDTSNVNSEFGIRVRFSDSKDASIIKLKGVPKEFNKYLKFSSIQ